MSQNEKLDVTPQDLEMLNELQELEDLGLITTDTNDVGELRVTPTADGIREVLGDAH